jgi:cation transport regulator ChaC
MKKKSRLEQHPEYWVGQEHAFYFDALRQILGRERDRYIQTERRKEWFVDRQYYFPALMLVGGFFYIEGECQSGWIKKYGGKSKRELYTLRFIRNVIVHAAGDLKSHRRYSKKKVNAREGRPPDVRAYVRRFVQNLKAGKVRDHKGRTVLKYIKLERNGVVQLTDEAFPELRRLFFYVLRNAGRLPTK